MKQLNLEHYGLVSINEKEKKETNGGFLGILGGVVFLHIVTEAMFNPQAHIDAFKKGFSGK